MPKLIDDDVERLAILLADLDLFDEVMRCKLFGPSLNRLDTDGAQVGQRLIVEDQPAIAFSCPLLQAALIVDLGRGYNREAGQKPLRCYLDKGNGWQKIPGKAALTIILKGSTALNPEVFGNQVGADGLTAESIL